MEYGIHITPDLHLLSVKLPKEAILEEIVLAISPLESGIDCAWNSLPIRHRFKNGSWVLFFVVVIVFVACRWLTVNISLHKI